MTKKKLTTTVQKVYKMLLTFKIRLSSTFTKLKLKQNFFMIIRRHFFEAKFKTYAWVKESVGTVMDKNKEMCPIQVTVH